MAKFSLVNNVLCYLKHISFWNLLSVYVSMNLLAAGTGPTCQKIASLSLPDGRQAYRRRLPVRLLNN